MEKTKRIKSNKKGGLLEIYRYTPSGWEQSSNQIGGIGEIRIKDNLKVLGTPGQPVVLPDVNPESSRFVSINVGAVTFKLEFKAGNSLVVFLAAEETTAWTNARRVPLIKL